MSDSDPRDETKAAAGAHDARAANAPNAPNAPNAWNAELVRIAERLRSTPASPLQLEGFRRAAVLVPILPRPPGLELLFTVRSAELSRHAGQISFPGGGLEPGEDAVDAALRETWEEVGVRLDRSSVLGVLDDLPSPAGYVATPVVAVMDPSSTLTPDPAEVADIFAAPVVELREITPSWEERRVEGLRRRIHYFPWSGRLIWGFTGNVLKDFLERAYASGTGLPGSDSRADRRGPPW